MMNTLNKQLAIESSQLKQLLSTSKAGLLTSIILAAVLAYMQLEVIAYSVVLTWFSLVVFVTLCRAVLIVVYQHAPAEDHTTDHIRLLKFRIGVLIAAAAWGLAGFLLFPTNNLTHQMFLVFMLAGMSAGGVISLSADFVSTIIFSVFLNIPLAIRLFMAGDGLSITMGFAVILYLSFIIISSRYIHLNLTENTALRLEALAREDAIRLSEERYRLLLNHSPVGIVHYDKNLIITYCNSRLTDILQTTADRLIGLDLNLLQDKSILPSLSKALLGEIGYYEGYYRASFSHAKGWIALTCASSNDANGNVVGGIGIIQDISERKQAEEEIEHLAFYDTLTRLPNRRLLLDRLNHALAASARSGRDGAILFLDLDHFKTLNDSLGHAIGDLLLQQVAERLAECLRESDTVARAARLGGDEFVVMLEDLSEHDFEAASQVTVVSEKILNFLNQPYQLATHEYHGTVSIGAAFFSDHAYAQEDLLKHADIAMYQAKKAGRNTVCFFDPHMQEAINTRADTDRELRKAIEKQQFQLHYQIQVDHMMQPVGAEALIRWMHPERGLISPFHFIPLAEETGLILPIGLWVLETACAQLYVWQGNPLTRDLTISINVSAKQFYQEDFVKQVQTAVMRHRINPMQLKLELTESILLENVDETIATMTALQDIGIRFSLDDFGTGYSSLQYLKQLPLYQLKIDQSFVRDIVIDSCDKAIVRTIIAMAKSLELEVIAEGVETVEQQQRLLNKGCMYYQGYLFGKPMPITEFEVMLNL